MKKKLEFTTIEQYRSYLNQNSKNWYKNNKEKKKEYQKNYYYNVVKKRKEAEKNKQI